jgi:hypothetical protein
MSSRSATTAQVDAGVPLAAVLMRHATFAHQLVVEMRGWAWNCYLHSAAW